MEDYKLKLYKYCDNFGYLKNYCDHKVWLHRICELNDPFEGRYICNHPKPSIVLKDPELYAHYYKIMNNEENGLSESEFKKFLNSPKVAQELDKRKFDNDQFKNYGILSLTQSPIDIPMWTYYANNHQGYCIEFELDFLKIQQISGLSKSQIKVYMEDVLKGNEILSFHSNDNHFCIFRVNYSKKLPVLQIEELLELTDNYTRNKFILRNTVGTKFKDWSHEKEFRIVTKEHSKKLVSLKDFIPFLLFKGIILGVKTKPENKRFVTKLFNKNQFEYLQANFIEGEYGLCISQYKTR